MEKIFQWPDYDKFIDNVYNGESPLKNAINDSTSAFDMSLMICIRAKYYEQQKQDSKNNPVYSNDIKQRIEQDLNTSFLNELKSLSDKQWESILYLASRKVNVNSYYVYNRGQNIVDNRAESIPSKIACALFDPSSNYGFYNKTVDLLSVVPTNLLEKYKPIFSESAGDQNNSYVRPTSDYIGMYGEPVSMITHEITLLHNLQHQCAENFTNELKLRNGKNTRQLLNTPAPFSK
ncbi:MAG: hypothetical protein LBM38_00905 [Clostridiales bacterium]|jgi:hypothetical protein|nr:hypothetical protein [Clostridiales bacterium]